jgi:rubrerythrin
MNVFDFAMKMELDGKAYYDRLAAETEVAGLKTIFHNLAMDEQAHFETFRSLKGGLTGPGAISRTLEHSRNIFERLVAEDGVSVTLENSLDGYRHGMENEAESARFYEDAAKKETNPETKALLLRIAEEEWSHYRILENLYEFTLAPQNYLAWGEFGNREAL